MKELLILQNGRVIDPLNGIDDVCDVWMKDGVIIPSQQDIPPGARYFDLNGLWVIPGLIDMHVHLRDPGQEYKETIETGAKSAAAGGFTAVACMPNTTPVNDCATVTQYICRKAESCDARVYPVGAVSHSSEGKELADYAEMKEAGIVAVTDDGLPVVDSQLMRRAMEYAKSHGLFVMSHSEENSLSKGGSMNESSRSTRMGLRGIPNAAEAIMVHRDIALSELADCHIHFAHISTKESLDLIRQAKKRGAKVTAETAPHYFSLTDAAVEGYKTNAKMNPPLRSEEDRLAVCTALQDGTLDAIATDHAPHSVLEKDVEFDIAANGIVGLETSLSLSLALVRDGVISEKRLVELMSCNPAQLLKISGGNLKEGQQADITVIDPGKKFVITAEDMVSKGNNSPFLGQNMQGKAVLTILGGRITFNELKRN